jgi:hypothetical protein
MRVNYHGLGAIIAIVAMVVVAIATGGAGSYLPYMILGIILYTATVFYITNQRERQASETRKIVSEGDILLQTRILFGAHLAFILLIGGIFLRQGLLMQIVSFAVAVIFGMLTPFIVVTKVATNN